MAVLAHDAPAPATRQTHDWDMSQPAIYSEDRWAAPFREMRAVAPINKITGSDFGDYWNISDHKAIQHIEALPDIFSSSYLHGGITIADDEALDVPEAEKVVMPMFIAMDRPDHTQQRRVVAPAFTPAEMQRLSTDIRARTGELLDSLPEGEEFDFVDRVSIELTTQMLAILFDFPWADRRKLTFWSDWAGDVELFRTSEGRQQRLAHMYEMGAYFQRLWDERLEKGEAPDLISRMIHSEMRNMTQFEYMGNLILLIVGGNDTTRNTMSGLAYALDKFPQQRRLLQANPDLIGNTVSEIIRWQTPLAHMRRTALVDYDLFGSRIKAGDKLILWYLSANRDESVFENPDQFDITRENARRHLAFGYGIHRCVGARLAELQIRILLEEMTARRMQFDLTGEIERVHACFVHGFRRMMVKMARY